MSSSHTPPLRALVIAGTGFIGGHVAEAFTNRGDQTTALVRSLTRARSDPRLEKARLAEGTVTEPPAEILDGPYDVVVYAAGVWRRGDRNPQALVAERCHRVYVQGVETFAERALAWKAHFVFMSGISRYGDAWRGIVSEKTPPGNLSVYGAHKRNSESILERLGARGLRWTALVPPEVYGSHDPGGYVRFVYERVKDRRFILIGNGNNRWSLCNVRNVADAVLHIAEREGVGPLHVADENPWSQREIAAAAAMALDRKSWFFRVPRGVALGMARINSLVPRPARAPDPFSPLHVRVRTETLVLDTSRAKEFGFRARHGLMQGMREAVDWWSRNSLGH